MKQDGLSNTATVELIAYDNLRVQRSVAASVSSPDHRPGRHELAVALVKD